MRWVGAVALALAAFWFGVIDNDWLDRRPVQRMLFLGHSLTYYNDMPAMVAKMADSANSPIRYDITMSAFPNAGLEDHWRNRKTRELLAQGGWDRVILQPERRAGHQQPGSSFFVHGELLLNGAGSQPPAIIISWMPHEGWYRREGSSASRAEKVDTFDSSMRGLAIATGADVIDVARVWDKVRAGGLPFSLYKDGNHPSLEGSYLAALVVYAALSRSEVANVTYVPWGMDDDHAKLLRERAQAALVGG